MIRYNETGYWAVRTIGENPDEYTFKGWANAGAWFAAPCKNKEEVQSSEMRGVYYIICKDTKEVIAVDSSD